MRWVRERRKMFSFGDKVTYKNNGVCILEGTVTKGSYGAQAEYYVLRPLAHPNSSVFVPCANETLTASIKPLMTPDQTREFLELLKSAAEVWDDDDRERAELLRSAVNSEDRLLIGSVIRTLSTRKEQRALAGKKLYSADERFLKEAGEILVSEISASLSVTEDEALSLILA